MTKNWHIGLFHPCILLLLYHKERFSIGFGVLHRDKWLRALSPVFWNHNLEQLSYVHHVVLRESVKYWYANVGTVGRESYIHRLFPPGSHAKANFITPC